MNIFDVLSNKSIGSCSLLDLFLIFQVEVSLTSPGKHPRKSMDGLEHFLLSKDTLEQRIGKSLNNLNIGLKKFIRTILERIHGPKWVIVAHESVEIKVIEFRT